MDYLLYIISFRRSEEDSDWNRSKCEWTRTLEVCQNQPVITKWPGASTLHPSPDVRSGTQGLRKYLLKEIRLVSGKRQLSSVLNSSTTLQMCTGSWVRWGKGLGNHSTHPTLSVVGCVPSCHTKRCPFPYFISTHVRKPMKMVRLREGLRREENSRKKVK